MRRILSLACGLALAAPAAAQDRASQLRQANPPGRPAADNPRDLQAELDRVRAQLQELEARLAKMKDGDRRPEAPKGPPDGGRKFDGPPKKDFFKKDGPKGDDRGPGPKADGPKDAPRGREVAPMPKAKDNPPAPAPKADGPMGGRGFGPPAGPGGPGFGPGGGRGFGPGGPGGPGGGRGFGPGGPPPFGPPRFTPPNAGTSPADLERRLDRIIEELDRLRDDLRRSRR
ncbi:MAG TPA: DUF5320 family protein [Urbifossiella sp.]|jgi:hypothetical protein|nr:DUF5320 family protein [Urbifossiella sp.]